ncbi:MAG: AIR synthase-related protein, partial [Dongiaceae bacterium]
MMLSESQERMLMTLKPDKADAARAIFEKGGIDFAVIGVTTDSGKLVVRHKGKIEADLPLPPLAGGAPVYDRPQAAFQKPAPLADPHVVIREAMVTLSAPGKTEAEMKSLAEAIIDDRIRAMPGAGAVGYSAGTGTAKLYTRLKAGAADDLAPLDDAARNLRDAGVVASASFEAHEEPVDLSDRAGGDSMLVALGKLMGTPDLCSRRWIFEQYDHTVMGDTVIGPGGDAALVRVHGTNRALAITTDATPRYVLADPREGAKQAVAETYRNICATGAAPLAITNCLNFGNPERPEIMAQLVGAIEGIAEACEALNYPVISGNVSLYNETNGKGILPTPVIGGVGVIADVAKSVSAGFRQPGEVILVVGETKGHLGQSIYLRELHGREEGAPPPVDLAAEKRNGDFVRTQILSGIVTACHDCSDGGLLVALAEMAMAGDLGATLRVPEKTSVPAHAFWFGEDQARYVATVTMGDAERFLADAKKDGVPVAVLGETGSNALTLIDSGTISVADSRATHEAFFPGLMSAGS